MRGAHLGVAAVTAVAAFLSGRLVLGEAAEASARQRLPLAPLPAEGRRDLTVLSADGTLERGAEGAESVSLAEGEHLTAGESVRVGPGARAVLRLGVDSRLTLSSGAALKVTAIEPRELTLLLERGRAEAELAHPGRTLRLTTTDGAEVIATGAAPSRFLVASEPRRVSVLNEAPPPVRLRARSYEVTVPSGFLSWSIEGGLPAPPVTPPEDPGLELADPAVSVDQERGLRGGILVHGNAHPLARVLVNGADVVVREDGSFLARLRASTTWPVQVLASLPSGPESLLEIPRPPALEAEPLDDGRVKKQSKKRTRGKARKGRSRRGR